MPPFDTTDATDTPPLTTGDPAALSVPVVDCLQLRVVREAGRETWFAVNQSGEALASLPLPMRPASSVRRVHVNGEVSEFSSSPDGLIVRPRRPLRAGAGTIVVVHFR